MMPSEEEGIFCNSTMGVPWAKCKMVWKSQLNNSATLNSHTNPSRCCKMLPDRLSAKRDELSGAPRLLHWCSSMFRKLGNIIQEYPEECMVVFEMLQNQTIRMCKVGSYWEYWLRLQDYSSASLTWSRTLLRSYWEYWPRLQDYSSASRTWSRTLLEWSL